MGATVFYQSESELATLTNTFAVAGTPTDPTTVTLTVTSPSGTTTTYTHAGGDITRTGAGVYTIDIPCTERGLWAYVWTGTGAASDTTAGTWTVQGVQLERLYCSPEELKSRMGIDDDVDDFEIAAAVETASRWVDDYCHRHFYRTTGTRSYPASTCDILHVDDLVSVTSVSVDTAGSGTYDQAWTGADYELGPLTGTAGVTRPYTTIAAVGAYSWPTPGYGVRRAARVRIVGVFGWPAVPAPVRQAAAIAAAEELRLKDAPFGVAGFGDFGPVRIRNNPKAVALLAPYRRAPVLVG